MLSFVVVFLLFFLPFIVFPFGISYFETPKIIISEICIIIIIIAAGLRTTFQNLLPNRLPLILFSILFVLSCYHLLFHPTSTVFLGNQFRNQGTFLLWILLLFALFSSQILLPAIPLWVFTSMSILELLLSLSISPATDGRAVGTLGEPNALASFTVVLWSFVAYRQNTTNMLSKIFFLLTTISTVITILISGSRSGLLAFGIGVIFFLLQKILRFSLTKATLICTILFFCSLFLPFVQKQPVYENRAEIWNAALIAGYQHPLMGWGFGNTEVALQTYNKKLYNRLRGYYVDSSHNIFLDFWVQGGFVGLSCLVTLIYIAICQSIKRKNTLIIGTLLVLLVTLSFNPASVTSLIDFWYILGIGI